MDIDWKRSGYNDLVLIAFMDSYINTDEYFDEITAWCDENRCGRRTAYNMWQFKNEKSVTMFLLRWE